MASTYSGHVVICGMGSVGYRVTQELLRFGREVVGTEIDPECRFVERAKTLGVPVLICDARRHENLLKAGVKHADAIIPCTDDELANLDIALSARELKPGIKVVLRMFDPDLARRIERGFGIHTAFSTSALAAPVFALAAMRVNVKYSFYVGDELLNLSEIALWADSPLVGRSIGELEESMDLSVVNHQSGGISSLHPGGDLLLKPGDRMLVLGSLEAIERLSHLPSVDVSQTH